MKGSSGTVCVTSAKSDLELKDSFCGAIGFLNLIPTTSQYSLAEVATVLSGRCGKARRKDDSRCKTGSIHCPHTQN